MHCGTQSCILSISKIIHRNTCDCSFTNWYDCMFLCDLVTECLVFVIVQFFLNHSGHKCSQVIFAVYMKVFFEINFLLRFSFLDIFSNVLSRKKDSLCKIIMEDSIECRSPK